MSAAIRFSNVSKRYRLGSPFSLLSGLEALAARARKQPVSNDNILWAIRDVSFSIEQGEMVGIMGHNGAGKSTLLKLLSKVAFPTSGKVESSGRIAAMIELGAGFHPDLSGRDNIYLSGAIQGMRRGEIDKLVEPIVEFSELERFIDTPVKFYSSGMNARLGFSVAAHVRADILLIDEVLSVGDALFKRKCLQRIHEMRQNGRTIVFVSHDAWSILGLCTRAMLLTRGQLAADGTPQTIVDLYRQQQRAAELKATAKRDTAAPNRGAIQSEEFAIHKIELLQPTIVERLRPLEPFTVRIHYSVQTPLPNPHFTLRFRRADGQTLTNVTSKASKPKLDLSQFSGSGTLEVYIDTLFPLPDSYIVEAELLAGDMPLVLARHFSDPFSVEGMLTNSQFAGFTYTPARWSFGSATTISTNEALTK